jgi:hypothetical protein
MHYAHADLPAFAGELNKIYLLQSVSGHYGWRDLRRPAAACPAD